MLFQAVLIVSAIATALAAGPQSGPPVFTATRVFKTVTDEAPFIVTATSTVTWTMSPSTVIPSPTGPGLRK
ncbi:hypothetical protein B0H10DRAFT_2237203 [Mycena sp. CBHHK59/15]|nr:hypothetical protein B0H10DRAFT_2237203 [Mycena sp. CBHHK59/15]